MKNVLPLSRMLQRVPAPKGSSPNAVQEYWKARARLYGRRAVLNVNHAPEDFDRVTQYQKEEIYPHFATALTGKERVVLDYGCGVGRFSNDLAQIISGRCLGVDVVSDLLELAPTSAVVEYRTLQEGRVPLPDGSCDVVWVCLVLGGLDGENLVQAVSEINRVLAPGGLLFLVENTSDKPDGEHWRFRSVREYQSLMPFAELSHRHDYDDLGERITILCGRKPQATPESVNRDERRPESVQQAEAAPVSSQVHLTRTRVFANLVADEIEYRIVRLKAALLGVTSVVRYLRNPNPRITARLLRAFGATVGERTTFKRTLFLDNVFEDQHSTGDFRYLRIGNNCYIGDCVFFDLTNDVILEDDVVVAGNVSFVSHADCNRSKYLESKFPRRCEPIRICRGSWIGFGATILSGVDVGKETVIAAYSLLREDAAANSVYSGVPARKAKDL
ncbi:methyltransferase domain-containing protein [Geomesophilobacter sediminis]|uniref:Methyltransferase domain-containing protein n=1 Tax=Geomesophilobacter sediminis TaxID=2798584 RepID=A0A8J7LU59_9BACT|nr:methyltransferase domain-containing protein [Geomesophilobacter sediminis]MBJ6724274.1 methyltransferase domain-containing protein [Geomesophilobacter sediminis]